ncbi:thioredoxin peroxidase dot5 [Clarireedia jacksonii]
MPVTLRKRPAKEPPAATPAPPAKKKGTVAKAVAKVKDTVKKAEPKAAKGKAKSEPAAPTAPAEPPAPKVNGAKKAPTKVAVGDIIDLEGFGGEIETNDGEKTTLKKLVDDSKSGVVLFTYPKASTPGCTNQVCFFRDSYSSLTVTGYSIFGLSKDSPNDNTKFKTKHELPYPLLCDTSSTLISAIGLKKAPSSTIRGVFVIDKSGKILAAEPGSPAGTLQVVEKLIGSAAAEPITETEATEKPKAEETTEEKVEEKPEEAAAPEINGTNGVSKEDAAVADVAADVADTAEKLDSTEEKPAEA